MSHKKNVLGRAHWLVDFFAVLGVALVIAGISLGPRSMPEILSRIFIDTGAAIAVAGVIAHILS